MAKLTALCKPSALLCYCGTTAPACSIMPAASGDVTKSKNFCAVSDKAVPSFVTSMKGLCTT